MDALDPKPWHPTPGDVVVFSNQGAGALGSRPRSGPFRDHRYIEGVDSGQIHGKVMKSSLVPITKKNPQGKPDPIEAARAAGLVNDRRGSREQCEYCGNYGHDYTVHPEAVRDVVAQRNKTDYP